MAAYEVGKRGFRQPTVNDVVDQLASGRCAATTNVKDAFLGLLYQIIETFKAAVTALEDFFLDALREAGNLVVGENGFLAGKSRCQPR